MPSYRLVGMSHYCGTRPGLTELWLRDEVREVSDEATVYLVNTFPSVFEPVTPTLSEPPAHRAILKPARR